MVRRLGERLVEQRHGLVLRGRGWTGANSKVGVVRERVEAKSLVLEKHDVVGGVKEAFEIERV